MRTTASSSRFPGILFGVIGLAALASPTWADEGGRAGCRDLPGYPQLKTALDAAVQAETSGLNNHMWATVVNRDGIVCAVAFSGTDRSAQWPGSRVISAQKANTANAFNLDSHSAINGSGQPSGLALSTANLYSATQPGGSLYGLQHSNPVDTATAYKGPSANYGTPNDPLVGVKIGGVNVFGGGLGLYDASKQVVGGLGVAGAPRPGAGQPLGGRRGERRSHPPGQHRLRHRGQSLRRDWQQRRRLRPSRVPEHVRLGRASAGALTP